ncbi:MAG TPA: nucleotide pyrophosphohydrolase [Phycisphaerae bacterium]|jgi:NTP pyrophosphatase (non-canonical NTP hydrolase)
MAGKKQAARRKSADKQAVLRDDTVTLEWLREMMREFLREREWQKYHVPRNLAASISVEAGELLELFQWATVDDAERRCASDEAFRKAVGEELCDVMMYCVSLANAMDLPLAETIAAKMAKNRLKYPAEKFRGHYERPLK